MGTRAAWEDELAHLLVLQDGVVGRRQLVELGVRQCDLDRMVRRRELRRLHRGVYVNHTGPTTWDQRAWAAVLVHHPAALTHLSALPDPPPDGAIHVAIDLDRSVRAVPGVVAHRTARWRERLAVNATRPRLAVPEAAVEAAALTSEPWEAFVLFCRVCQTRQTTPAAIASALRGRRGVPRRTLLLDMLDDLASGACSVLEREYLVGVERAHGLPPGERQGAERTTSGAVYRDVRYAGWGVLVELDGHAFHRGARQRGRDLDRDLEAVATSDDLTLRLGWRQVLGDRCVTARRVEAVLRRRGWGGHLTACPSCST